MTTTDIPPTIERRLRRSREGRVGAGVASGLGEYFALDPVLFRVLFATSAFFGGAGILAYLIAWVAIPEAGTERAPIDGWVGELRRRRIPFWLAAAVAGLILWAVAFSWWAPGPVFPIVAVVIVLVVFFNRRGLQSAPPVVSVTKEPTEQPNWLRETGAWIDESKVARRERRRRSLPVRLATLAALAVALVGLAVADSVAGIWIQTYFWTAAAVLVAGLLVGLVLRRTPWTLTLLVIPSLIGAIGFAGSHAQFGDGLGKREWKPTASPAGAYRLAIGEGVLDLRALDAQAVPRRIDVTVGAGRVHIIAPKTLNLTVLANVHFGEIDVDHVGGIGNRDGGAGVSRSVPPLSVARGTPLTVDVHLADGQIFVQRV